MVLRDGCREPELEIPEAVDGSTADIRRGANRPAHTELGLSEQDEFGIRDQES